MNRRHFLTSLALMSLGLCAQAATPDEVGALLAMQQPPFGVVFEIAERDGKALDWAIPEVNQHIRRLRARFPDIGLAVVSHGREQFALTSEQQGENREVHAAVQALVKEDVPVHVCGTHARWRGKGEADFPEYVDVAPAGPTEIRNYQAMGYQLIRVSRP